VQKTYVLHKRCAITDVLPAAVNFFLSICVNAVIITCIFGNKFCLCFPFLFKANASSNEPVAICFNYQRISICGIGTQ